VQGVLRPSREDVEVRISIDHEVPAYGSYAAERTRGLYNVGVEDGQHFHLDVELPDLDGDWQIGVVVGPSGSGKTSILRYLVDEGWREWSLAGAGAMTVRSSRS
jgi:hypothetical protein